MKFFVTFFLLCAIVGSILAVSSTTWVDYGSGSTTEATSATTLAPVASPSSPCGPRGPCGLLQCLGGGCGQKVYIFN
ncbi:hypothetical protein KR054_002562 [Drosophila jambulina]|nr:hypothetical protein KR054_002562 [Drosophila jambulina]